MVRASVAMVAITEVEIANKARIRVPELKATLEVTMHPQLC